MGSGKFGLTNEERVLLHLLDYQRYKTKVEVPVEVTQEGMSKALGITQSHVSYALKNLAEGGDVDEAGLSHIEGRKRRRRAYFLSDKGFARGRELLGQLEKSQVEIVGDGGRKRKVDVKAAMDATGLDMPGVLSLADERRRIDLAQLRADHEPGGESEGELDDVEEIIEGMSELVGRGVSSTAKVVKDGVDLVEKVSRGSIELGKGAAKRTVRGTRKVAKRVLRKYF